MDISLLMITRTQGSLNQSTTKLSHCPCQSPGAQSPELTLFLTTMFSTCLVWKAPVETLWPCVHKKNNLIILLLLLLLFSSTLNSPTVFIKVTTPSSLSPCRVGFGDWCMCKLTLPMEVDLTTVVYISCATMPACCHQENISLCVTIQQCFLLVIWSEIQAPLWSFLRLDWS